MLKDTRFILVRAECPYIQFAAAHVISTERFVVGGTNGRERDMSQVSDGKVKQVLRAWMLLSYVVWCVRNQSVPLVGCVAFLFIDQGEAGIIDGRKKKNQRPRSFESAGSSISLERALLTW